MGNKHFEKGGEELMISNCCGENMEYQDLTCPKCGEPCELTTQQEDLVLARDGE